MFGLDPKKVGHGAGARSVLGTLKALRTVSSAHLEPCVVRKRRGGGGQGQQDPYARFAVSSVLRAYAGMIPVSIGNPRETKEKRLGKHRGSLGSSSVCTRIRA